MTIPTYEQLRAYRESIGAPWFTKAWDLNLLIGRSGNVGLWDDLVLWAWTDDAGREVVEAYPATGDAWLGEWTSPTHPDGCIWIVPQHVPGGFALGSFKNRKALRQRREFECVRWPADKGHVPTVDELMAMPSFKEIRGTHLHDRVSGKAPEKPAIDDSEGCTVLLYKHHGAASWKLVELQSVWRGTIVVSPTFCSLSELLGQ